MDEAPVPVDELALKAADCRTTSGAGPITVGTAAMGLPLQLQGVFWLQDQGPSSSLMSFATSRDGGGWSKFNLNDPHGEHIKIKFPNDKVWSFHSASPAKTVAFMGSKYYFKFEDKNGKPP